MDDKHFIDIVYDIIRDKLVRGLKSVQMPSSQIAQVLNDFEQDLYDAATEFYYSYTCDAINLQHQLMQARVPSLDEQQEYVLHRHYYSFDPTRLLLTLNEQEYALASPGQCKAIQLAKQNCGVS